MYGSNVELEKGLDDGGGDRVVAAAGAQRRHAPLVVAQWSGRARSCGTAPCGRSSVWRCKSCGFSPSRLPSIASTTQLAGRWAARCSGGSTPACAPSIIRLEREQALQLRIPILLDHEDPLVLVEKFGHLAERKRLDAHVSSGGYSCSFRTIERLRPLRRRSCRRDTMPHSVELALLDDGFRNQRSSRLPLAQQPVDDLLVLLGVFGVRRRTCVCPEPRVKYAPFGCDAGIGPVRYAVAVHVQVAVERLLRISSSPAPSTLPRSGR